MEKFERNTKDAIFEDGSTGLQSDKVGENVLESILSVDTTHDDADDDTTKPVSDGQQGLIENSHKKA